MLKTAKLIFLGLLSYTVLPSTALATPTGCGTRIIPDKERHYIGGYRFGNPNFWGISGPIETSTLDLCPGVKGKPNFTAAWVGIDNNSVSAKGWVQMGYARRSDFLTAHVYLEAQHPYKIGGPRGDGHYIYYLAGTPSGVNIYTINLEWNGTQASSFWKYYRNRFLVWALNYNNVPIIPVLAQAMVELKNPANQIPGTKANPVSFGGFTTKSTKTGRNLNFSLYKKATDAAISSHAKTDMNIIDTDWNVWDSRY